jgi:hypothetical protein
LLLVKIVDIHKIVLSRWRDRGERRQRFESRTRPTMIDW